MSQPSVINGRPVSQYVWSNLRRRWQTRLPQPCPRCSQPVQPWDTWELDHVGHPVALGGMTYDIRPAHASCNRRAGAELRHDIHLAGLAALRASAPIASERAIGADADFLVGSISQLAAPAADLSPQSKILAMPEIVRRRSCNVGDRRRSPGGVGAPAGRASRSSPAAATW